MTQLVIDYYYYFQGTVHSTVYSYKCSTVGQGRPVSAVTNKKGRQGNQKQYVLYIESVCNSYIGVKLRVKRIRKTIGRKFFF